MRSRIIILLTFFTLFSHAQPADNREQPASNNELQSQDDRTDDREAIRKHIDTIFRAYMRKDRATVRSTHTEDWHGFSLGTRSLVRGLDEYMVMAERWLGDPHSRMTSYSFEEYETLFQGDLALVFYIADVEGIAHGNAYKDKFRSLDVYAKRNREWIQLASNLDRHPDETNRRNSSPATITPELRSRIIKTRLAVWNAWFKNDQETLKRLLPAELVAINNGEERWHDRNSVLAAAKEFANSGSRLIRLEFPQTEIQAYGNTIILYSRFVYELETDGKREVTSGRATETFVDRDGTLVNTGWHLDSGK